MSSIHCYTSISFSYLSRARVLAETVRKYHPDWTLWICISDREPDGFTFELEDEQFDHVLWADEFGIPELRSWMFKHNVVEMCTAVKGLALNRILDAGADTVVYLDPDIALFSDLAIVAEPDKSSVLLTPHLTDPETTDASILENERSALLHGVYNLGFLAVRNTAEGRRFARWWQDRLMLRCYEEAAFGVYTDQRWCDLVPAMFEGVKVVRDAGLNVASWNLSNRTLSVDTSGQLLVNGVPLRFFHFTKIDHVGEVMIERYARGTLVFELIKWYRTAMHTHEAQGVPNCRWAYERYSDGTPIAQYHRRLYRARRDLEVTFPNPFDALTYLAWLRLNGLENVPRSDSDDVPSLAPAVG
jgi:hypothetical protein